MNLLDLLLAVIVGASTIAGLRSGFTRTAFGLVSTLAGVILGFWFYDVPGAWLVDMTGSRSAANLFGFFIVFLAVMALGALAGRLVAGFFKLVGLSIVDRLAGAAFGLARGAFVAAAAVAVLLAATPRPVPNWMKDSALLPYALGVAGVASKLAPQSLKDAVSESVGEIKKAWNDEVEKAKRKATGAFTPEPPPAAEPVKPAVKAPRPVEIIPPARTKTKPKAKTPKEPPPKVVSQ